MQDWERQHAAFLDDRCLGAPPSQPGGQGGAVLQPTVETPKEEEGALPVSREVRDVSAAPAAAEPGAPAAAGPPSQPPLQYKAPPSVISNPPTPGFAGGEVTVSGAPKSKPPPPGHGPEEQPFRLHIQFGPGGSPYVAKPPPPAPPQQKAGPAALQAATLEAQRRLALASLEASHMVSVPGLDDADSDLGESISQVGATPGGDAGHLPVSSSRSDVSGSEVIWQRGALISPFVQNEGSQRPTLSEPQAESTVSHAGEAVAQQPPPGEAGEGGQSRPQGLIDL